MTANVTTDAAPYRLSPLETAGGIMLGDDPTVGRLPDAGSDLTCRRALEQAILPALRRQPCLVSFSGGRDSSAVLAVATHVARRKGLPLPIPITMRFPRIPDTDEDSWQELVVGHLGLPDWIRLEFDDELDEVGPYAQTVLRQFGPLWPYNVHSHLPLAGQGPGGTLLTGFGGDELFTPPKDWARVNHVLARKVRPVLRDIFRVGAAYGLPPVRRRAARRQLGDAMLRPWLRADAQRELTDAAVRQIARQPIRWDSRVDEAWWRTRYRTAAEDSLSRVGSIHDVVIDSPLTDPLVLGAIRRVGGRTGFSTRAAVMELLAGDLLPGEVLGRRSKAVMTEAFWSRHSTAFAAGWNGTGVDPEIVDVELLRQEWTKGAPADARSYCLLQSAWWSAQRAAGVSGDQLRVGRSL